MRAVRAKISARHEDVVFMYDTGEWLPRIAERSGLNINTVKSVLRQMGRDPNRGEDVKKR